MAAQGFIARVNGKLKQVFAILVSAGAADAGKIPGLDGAGKLDASFMPAGLGANQVILPTTENLASGDFVNLYDNAGVLSMRKADNSNNREAWGYVNAATVSPTAATALRLGTTNANRSALTPGATYWLGTAGGVISAPLDPATQVGKTCQILGVAKSATELVTAELDPVLL